MQQITIPDIQLGEMRLAPVLRDGEFLGLGAVSCAGYPLRSPSRPWGIELRTPDGVQLTDFRVTGVRAEGNGVLLDLGMSARAGGAMEWMLHEIRPRINTADWYAGPRPLDRTTLTLELCPVLRQIGETSAVGFSYRYHYQSDAYPIYKLLDRGTWEPGGSALGCEFWQRSAFVEPTCTIASREQRFSTEWHLPAAGNPDIFQFLPWQTGLEGFTMTWCAAGGLLTWATQLAHIRSLWEKKQGVDELEHWHEHCADLSLDFSTAPVEVLWMPGERTRVERINLWQQARELVADTLHAQAGLRRERVTTYGMIEEWSNADLVAYRERGLPGLLDAGVKTICLANQFQNNMNTFGVGNMCCTVDYRVEETVGEEQLTDFCAAANAGGAAVEMWGNTALSTFGLTAQNRDGKPNRVNFLPRAGSVLEMIDRARAPFVRNPAGHMEADHYAPVFAQLNMRDPDVRAYWLRCWRDAHEQIGLSGIFLDSSFNLSSDKFHWVANPPAVGDAGGTLDQTQLLGQARPACEPSRAILSQFHAHLALIAEMQAIGYAYCGEDLGVFGVHRSGPRVEKRVGNLWMWQDCIEPFDALALEAAGVNPDDVFFQGLAYRMMWTLHWVVESEQLSWHYSQRRGPYDDPTDEQRALLHAFNAVEPYMDARTVLPDECGVQYRCGATTVLWAFTQFDYPLPREMHVQDVLSNTEVPHGPTLPAKQRRIYLIEAV